MGLVEADDVPVDAGEGFRLADKEAVGGEHHVVRLGVVEHGVAVGSLVKDLDGQGGGETA